MTLRLGFRHLYFGIIQIDGGFHKVSFYVHSPLGDFEPDRLYLCTDTATYDVYHDVPGKCISNPQRQEVHLREVEN